MHLMTVKTKTPLVSVLYVCTTGSSKPGCLVLHSTYNHASLFRGCLISESTQLIWHGSFSCCACMMDPFSSQVPNVTKAAHRETFVDVNMGALLTELSSCCHYLAES